MPAFEKHNERSFAGPARGGTLEMSALLGALPDNSWPLIGKESPGRYSAFFSDWNTSSEEDEVYREEEYDSYASYDEVEVANAVDDMFKILEGEHLDGSGLTAKAEYDEVGSSDIEHLDTGFEDRYPRPIEDCRATTQELSLVLVFAHTGKYIPPIGTYGEGLSDV
ncbi:hypothetical protein KXX17_006783 [Aspergillus fumigatus]|nr:hypothetical protein KXX17_006783 [Aspergillus fumigatus]